MHDNGTPLNVKNVYTMKPKSLSYPCPVATHLPSPKQLLGPICDSYFQKHPMHTQKHKCTAAVLSLRGIITFEIIPYQYV